MMLGESHRANPTIHVPPWSVFDDPMADMFSPYPISDVYANTEGNANQDGDYSLLYQQEEFAALPRYLPSNESGGGVDVDSDLELSGQEWDAPMDAYSCDQFRMFEFKVRKCARGRSHDWTECPYAHPGEKARRRDPRKYHYSGTACPEFRKGSCKKGDVCEFAHGVFECWLHPARYRTQPCKDGTSCRRRVCFFAHTPEQLRLLPQQSPRSVNSSDSYDGSPLRHTIEASCMKSLPFVISPSSISPPATPPAQSPPMSPMTQTVSRSLGSNSVHDMMASLRNLQLGKVKSFSPRNVHIRSPGYGSPRGSILRPGFSSMPTTPTKVQTRTCLDYLDAWDQICEEDPPMERVESGRDIRAKMFEKLCKENPLERPNLNTDTSGTDVGWVSDLVE